MPIAKASDVQTSLMRELNEQESKYINQLLERAETLIRVKIPNLTDRAGVDAHFKDLVTQVEAESVARVFRAGESGSGIYSSESEDGYTYRLNFKVASGLLDILPEEWARLLGMGKFTSVAPRSDGYLARRRKNMLPPNLHFQYGWPAYDQEAEAL